MNKAISKFRGTGVAIITPFKNDGSVDYKGLEKVVQHIIKGKCEYIVVLGTTGESVTLSKDEKKAVVKCVVNAAQKKVPVVLGHGGNNTQELLEGLNTLDFTGIDALLSVSPYYNKPTQEGIYQHYKAIAQNSPLPIILYNVPGRTSSNILAETTLRLAHDFKNIIAVKEASGNIEQMMRIIKDKPKDFLVISGDDALTLPLSACGGDGVISVVANAFPKDYSEMTRLSLKGDFAKAQKLHYKLLDIIGLLFVDGNPAGVKYAMNQLGICNDKVRLPLVGVTKPTAEKLKALINKY
ncbi:MAG: 4-hydroxy-tetrahydrodipicolinate synthase [Bacteroidia bacterium]|nr:4-hydroxy-tetrahydrodipicolinate synthase [Bacteroidia bacterium]